MAGFFYVLLNIIGISFLFFGIYYYIVIRIEYQKKINNEKSYSTKETDDVLESTRLSIKKTKFSLLLIAFTLQFIYIISNNDGVQIILLFLLCFEIVDYIFEEMIQESNLFKKSRLLSWIKLKTK